MLESAGIHQAHAVAACTSDDAINLSLCFLAREKFNVPRTIARINNPRKKVAGTKMTYAGMRKPQDRANVIAYIKKASAPK